MAADRPQSELVSLEKECIFPPHERIVGSLVELLPLREEHADELFSTIAGQGHPELYKYLSYGPFDHLDAFRAHIKHYANTKDPQFYAIKDVKTGKVGGHLSFLRIDVLNRVIEIGHVLYGPSLQRTTAATEAFYILAEKAFECGYRRLEWKCDSGNAASRRAALRLGFTFEGVFRQHMIVKGRNRDTAWFSIIDAEWPKRMAAMRTWMGHANFDEEGKQIRSLDWYQTEYG